VSGHGFAKIHGLQWNLQSEGYQFYTTTSNVEWAESDNFGGQYPFFPSGSSVWVPIPKSVDKITAKPIASLVQQPPQEGWHTWKYIGPTPDDLDELNIKMFEMFKLNGIWQVDGIGKHSWFQQEQRFQLIDSWVQPSGQIAYSGTLAPASMQRYVEDNFYDLAPGLTTGFRYSYRLPDTDWLGRGCYAVVGGRTFYIGNDTENYFYCCPVDGGLDFESYSVQYALYGGLGYKANINPAQAQRVRPIYPSWVYESKNRLALNLANPNVAPCEPRYNWSYHSSGLKAIAVLLERKESESTFHKVEYAPGSLQATPNPSYPYSSPDIPTETQIGEGPPEVDPSTVFGKDSDPRPLEIDRRGYVELEFDIEITGPELDEFVFTVSVLDEQSPDDLYALNIGALVDIAYAQPLDWTKTPGNLLTADVFSTEENAIHSLWIQLYRHERQKHLVDTYDGEVCLNVSSRTVGTFRKGKNFTKMFALPLAQSHGDGYTYTNIPGVLPAPAHDPVWNPDQSFGSRYPQEEDFPEGFADRLYYYSATITHLDLPTLSFYYTARLLSQYQGELEPVDHVPQQPFYHYTKILNRARKLCNVVMMGRSIDEYSIGDPTLSLDWMRGWIRFAGSAELFDKEEEVDSKLIHNVRASGFTTKVSMKGLVGTAAFRDTSLTPALRSWSSTSADDQIYQVNVMSPYDGSGMFPQMPWWLMGACGHITQAVIASMVVDYIPVDINGLNGGTVTKGSPPTGLGSINISNIASVMAYIYNAYSNYSVSISSEPPYEADFSDYYTANPFLLASGMSEEEFVVSTANSYTVAIFNDIKTYYDSLEGDDVGAGLYTNAWRIDVGTQNNDVGLLRLPLTPFAFNTGGGSYVNSSDFTKMPVSDFNALTELSGDGMPWVKLFNTGYVIKQYELGAHYYNQAMYDHFTPGSMDVLHAIRVTANGSCSYLQRGFYEFNKEFSTSFTVNENASVTLSNGNQIDNGYYRSFNLHYNRPITGLAVSDIEWDSIDGVSWDYNSIRTKHLYLYNLAYQVVEIEDKKTHLASDEVFTTYYSKSSFIPVFTISDVGGESFLFPCNYGSERLGIRGILHQYSLPIGTKPQVGPLTEVSKVDPRPGLSCLRYSPLFIEKKRV